MAATDLLLFTAHCDDAELWAGGTITRLARNGGRVCVAIANHDPTRRREAELSARILGYEVTFHEGSAGSLAWAQDVLESTAPDVLMTHPVADPHFEHARLGATIIEALTKSLHRKAYPRRWYAYDTYYSTTSEGFSLLIDISDEFETKASALRCHKSQQPDELVAMARSMNSLNGQRIRASYAEAFQPFPLLGRWPRLRDLP